MELQSFWPFVGILVAIGIACVSGAWMFRKAMGDLHVDLSDVRGDLSDLRGEMRALNKRVDGLDNHMDKRMDDMNNHMNKRMDDMNNHMNKRMDGLDKRMDDFGAEIRGINEFLRREAVKDSEKDKES